MDQPAWRTAVSQNGFIEVFSRYFGQAFDYSIDPLIPENLSQPEMQLPIEEGTVWSFTGGPHGSWGSGSAWGALDFAPPGDALGCVQSDEWVAASSSGVVVRSENGVVSIDLDGDGYEETGWVLLYLHIETRDRIPVGTVVKPGDRIGHPSCEGGISSGTHLHLARKFNGEWIPADQDIPFVLDGWVSQGTGVEYNGYLVKNGQSIEAWDRRTEENQIQR
jgi:murein DD-endopeptidase MepM/ murein hydrolase activator NlpD